MKNAVNFDGFSIHDEKTDELLTPFDVAKRSFPDWEWLALTVNGFALGWDGLLWITTRNNSIYQVPKDGKYQIRFNSDGMRW